MLETYTAFSTLNHPGGLPGTARDRDRQWKRTRMPRYVEKAIEARLGWLLSITGSTGT